MGFLLCWLFGITCPRRIIVVENNSENIVQPEFNPPSQPSIKLTIRKRPPTILIRKKRNRREKIVFN